MVHMTFLTADTYAGSERALHYVEPIARARSGKFRGKSVGYMLSGLPQGLPKAGDRGLITPIHGAVLLGRRAVCLLADVRIRERTTTVMACKMRCVPSPRSGTIEVRLS